MKQNPPDHYLSGYNAKEHESVLYAEWESAQIFNPDNFIGDSEKTFTTIMPPPNANGRLHVGHALDTTLKDIIVRYYRMKGYKTLMVPGSDHAGFETQGVYEKELQKQGRSRFGMKNEDLYKEIYEFVMDKKQFMEDDWKRLGVSCDWTRNAFTLEPKLVTKVQETFIKMFSEGLVYRGERIVHWNPKFGTSLSEIETEFVEKTDKFYNLKYGPFIIGTSRPETKFGDKYVVVHPDDARYSQFKDGETFICEWINGPITATVIKDTAIDMEFGTGAMTITPWHDQTDFEIAKRRNLPYEQIIDFNGKLLPIAGEFSGMKIEEARIKMVEKLQSKGLVESINENYVHNVRVCERTGVTVEPQIKPQWFVKMEPFAKMVLGALDSGEVKIVTETHEKILRHWMNNPIDWNISRQIVWGIQIPAWSMHNEDGTFDWVASATKPNDGKDWVQDTDTFDTWFSSGQWPLLTLGYPDSKDFKDFYPTQFMETGTELIFKWVPRMIMFGIYLTGKAPFKDVYLHGMVLDKFGKKMSKSKGNVISPLEVSENYGIDALRMALIMGTPAGASTALSFEKIGAYKKYANKLWNIARFCIPHFQDVSNFESEMNTSPWIHYIEEMITLKNLMAKNIEEYKLHLAADSLYQYTWHTFADTIIEELKADLSSVDNPRYEAASKTISYIFTNLLILNHPFMPFITERIWKDLRTINPELETFLAVKKWG